MMVACCGAANWDRGRKVYQRYLACCDDIQNAFNQAPDIMLPMHMLYILLALQCGESKIAHDVLAILLMNMKILIGYYKMQRAGTIL